MVQATHDLNFTLLKITEYDLIPVGPRGWQTRLLAAC